MTADLTTNPVLPSHQWPLCLDGVVAHRVMRAELGLRFGTGEVTAEDCAVTDKLDLPLAKIEIGGSWVWAASQALAPNGAGQAVEWQHKSGADLGLYERRVAPDAQARVDPARAQWKPGRLPRVVTVTSGVSWLVDTPDPDRLMAILGEVAAVGKGYSRGWGQVREWQIAEVAWFDWGPALRPLPQPGTGFMVGTRPPYWHAAQRREVAVP